MPILPIRNDPAVDSTRSPSPVHPCSSSVSRQLIAPLVHGSSSSPERAEKYRPPQAAPRLTTLEGGARGLHYKPAGCSTAAKGLVVLAPGGKGGMGPGVPASSKHDFFSPGVPSIYSVLARRMTEEGYAVMHFSWSRPSAWTASSARTPRRVRECADDVAAAAHALRVAHDYSATGKGGAPLPMVLVGFSGEACAAVLAAATLSLGGSATRQIGPLAGVVCLAPSLRTNDPQMHYGGVDTVSCVDALSQAQLPLMLMHGLLDMTNDPEASALTYEASRGPKTAVFVNDADHNMLRRYDDVLSLLLGWVPGLLRRYDVVGASGGQFGTGEIDAEIGIGRVITL